jgi:cystathionine gamma-synthase
MDHYPHGASNFMPLNPSQVKLLESGRPILDNAAEGQRGAATEAIHGGLSYRSATGAVIPPVYLTSTFEKGNAEGFDYTRSGNPNFRNLESILGALEAARYATVFGSGVSAITAIVSSLKSGDRILAEENLYGCTFRLFEQVFKKFGIAAEYVDLSDPKNYKKAADPALSMVWIESPTNPSLKVLDMAAIALCCNRGGNTLVVDNTFASSYLQQPLAWGADISLSSTTKYINGHSDCLGGAVCTNNKSWHDKMVFAQKALGLQPAPFDAWMVTRGVKTLAVRMERHVENALALANFLEGCDRVREVRYPFLPSHPQYALAKRQMSGGSGIITATFNLSLTETEQFLKSLNLFTLAESLGGIESLVCHPATMTHAAIPKETRESVGITDALVRFSVGIENVGDLKNDIAQALATVKPQG